MVKRISSFVFSLLLVFVLVSPSGGFDNNPNKVNPNDPNDPLQRDYTRENSIKPKDQGGYSGGHDTITAEGMLLKKKVHASDTDGGDAFNLWADDKTVLPSLRTGAHDEDSTALKIFGITIRLDEPPIGPNGDGNWIYHFYNPDTKKGLWGNDSAIKRAKSYITEIDKKLGCNPQALSSLRARYQ